MNLDTFTSKRAFVETPSGRISYVENGKGLVALFVHGVLLNSYLWRHQLAPLNADLHNKVGDVKGLLGIRSRKPARCLESSSLTRSRSNLSAAAGGADSNSVAH